MPHSGNVLDDARVERMPDLAEQSRHETGAEEHEHRDPVCDRGENDRPENGDRDDDHDGASESDARRDEVVRRPVSRLVDDRESDEVDGEHVDGGDRGRAEEAREQQPLPPDRANDERLQ
jgi:hypothetical protein